MKFNILLLLGLVFLSSAVLARKNTAFSKEYVKRMESLKQKDAFDSYSDEILLRRNEIYKLSLNERIHKKGQKKKKAIKKATKDVAEYDRLLKIIKKTKKSRTTIRKNEYLKKLDLILSYDYALKVEGNGSILEGIKSAVSGYLEKGSVKKNSRGSIEASNLLIPGNKKTFYTQSEIKRLKQRGRDISKLNPPSDSPFTFTRRDISKVDVRDSYLKGKNPLYKGIKVWWPKVNSFELKKIRKTQSKPKMDVFAVNPKTGKKEIFKIKVGREIHSDPTVSALGNALGIYTDLTKYIREIKVHLGDLSYTEFKSDWNSYFFDYDLDFLIKRSGRDSKGEYIVFKDGLIEQKFKKEKSYIRVGPWGWGENGHNSYRDARSFYLFNIWVGNQDLKEAENNKLILRKKKGHLRQFKVMHDMGFALGNLFREKPVDFQWDVISRNSKRKVSFNFFNFQNNTGFDHVTWDDARWMVRKIAQLTRTQIEAAVTLGGWPKIKGLNFHQMLVEKLISRRNGLVKAFKLDGEVLPNGRTIRILKFKKFKIKDIPRKIEGYTVNFEKVSAEISGDWLHKIPNIFVDVLRFGVGKANKVEIDPIEIGLDSGVIAQILINTKRKIIRNPNPRTEDETFIVKDSFLAGTRLGYGFVLSGDVAVYREYSIIRSYSSEKEARFQRSLFSNLLLPKHIMLGKLPRKHILVVSDFVETRGKVEIVTKNSGLFKLGTEASSSRINLGRVIISKASNNEVILYEDKANFNRHLWKAFVKASIIKMPFASLQRDQGHINRDIYKINLKKGLTFKEKRALEDVFRRRDFSLLKKEIKPKKLKSTFVERNSKINIFGILGRKTMERKDKIEKLNEFSQTIKGRDIYQASKTKEVFRGAVLGGETLRKTTQFLIVNNDKKKKTSNLLRLEYVSEDQRVKSKELEYNYLGFLNSVGKEKALLDYSASKHSSNREYSKMNIRLNLEIYPRGIRKVLSLKMSDLLRASSKVTGISFSKIKKLDQKMLAAGGRTHSQRFKFRKRNYDLYHYMSSLRLFYRKITYARQKGNSPERSADRFLEAFHQSVKRSRGSFDPLVLHTVLRFLKKNDYYLEVSFDPYNGTENKLPERIRPFNVEGKKRKYKDVEFFTNREDLINIYKHFVN